MMKTILMKVQVILKKENNVQNDKHRNEVHNNIYWFMSWFLNVCLFSEQNDAVLAETAKALSSPGIASPSGN